MVLDTAVLVSEMQTKTKQAEVSLTPQEVLSQTVVLQSTSQCGAQCPICQSAGQSGACGLNEGHAGQHVCNRVSSHTWSGPGVPGPHTPSS